VTIKSLPGRGCTVLARLPLRAEDGSHRSEDHGK